MIFEEKTSINCITQHDELLSFIKVYKDMGDTYLLSPNYYFLTGRKGLYVYKNNSSGLIFCLHPNLEATTIVFPLVNREQTSLFIDFLLLQHPLIKRNIRVIRIQNDYMKQLKILNSQSIKYEVVQEDILDWRYPSIQISTENILNLKGKKLRDLRYNINKINYESIHCERYSIQKHLSQSLELTKKWCLKNISQEFDFDNLYSPYEFILKNSQKLKGIHGYVLYYNEKLVAFNFLDEPLFSNDEMVSLIFIADVDFKGIPSYMRYIMCKILHPKIKKISIGGSETYGLYKFKKKFAPTNELYLSSLEINTVANKELR